MGDAVIGGQGEGGKKKFDCFIKKTKYRDVLKKSSKEISFKLTDLLLWKIMIFIFADVISLSWYNSNIQNPEGKDFVCVLECHNIN